MAKQFGGKIHDALRQFREALAGASAELPACTVVHGECDFLRTEAVADFRRAWFAAHPDGDLAVLRTAGEGRPATLADMVAEMSGGSLFARDKLIVVRQAEKALFPQSGRTEEGARPAAAGDREKAFAALLDNPPAHSWLLLESAQLPRNRTLGKKLAASCRLVPCAAPTQREIPQWLEERAAGLGKRIDPAAADLLVRAHGAELGALAGEIEKLALFAGDARDIDSGMVGEFLTGTIELDIFGFTNAIEARDRRKAVFYARRIVIQGARDQKGKLENSQKASHNVLNILAGTVQGLLRARVALAERRAPGDFAADERLAPWRATKLYEAAGRFQLRELRVMARDTAERLRRVHDTGGDPLLVLEEMAVRFTAPAGNGG